VPDVVEDSSGEQYEIDLADVIGESIKNDVQNLSDDIILVNELSKELINQDSLWKDYVHLYKYIFSLKQIENLIYSLKTKYNINP